MTGVETRTPIQRPHCISPSPSRPRGGCFAVQPPLCRCDQQPPSAAPPQHSLSVLRPLRSEAGKAQSPAWHSSRPTLRVHGGKHPRGGWSQRRNASSSIPWMGSACCALNTSSEAPSWTRPIGRHWWPPPWVSLPPPLTLHLLSCTKWPA